MFHPSGPALKRAVLSCDLNIESIEQPAPSGGERAECARNLTARVPYASPQRSQCPHACMLVLQISFYGLTRCNITIFFPYMHDCMRWYIYTHLIDFAPLTWLKLSPDPDQDNQHRTTSTGQRGHCSQTLSRVLFVSNVVAQTGRFFGP